MDTVDLETTQEACDLILTDGVYDFHVLASDGTADPGAETIRYSTVREAEELIETSISCTGDTHDLQSFVAKHHHGSAWTSSDIMLRKKAAELVVTRDIAVELRAVTDTAHGMSANHTPTEAIAKNFSMGSLLPDFGSSTITYKIVEDQPDDYIPGVMLKVTLTDDRYKELISANDGRVVIENVKGRTSGFELDGPGLFGATLDNTFAYVAMGNTPTGSEEESPGKATRVHHRRSIKNRQSMRYIAQINEHKVSEGETLSSIAKDNNTTFRDLAFFNWGTHDREKVLARMTHDVGCKTKSPDGRDLRFTGDESPGIVFVPTPLAISDLPTNTEHTIRVKKTGFDLTYLYKIDLDDPEVKNDTVTLTSDDDTWKYTLPMSDLQEAEENWVRLVFPCPPKKKKYTLTHNSGDTKDAVVIFDSLPEDQLRYDVTKALEPGAFT
ncbi:LysM peptidoglycan-binding domain-containing protein [Desulfoluna spongiiphila]|uniref:LysM domain-containing protein n=1 Tax=Desulfoluna spongiiphila TaxID=419481 RepID=A0A1G5JCK6_9BACT|nr:LysM domain-containing protein [Desulfoluna spongiiphila]SCY85519.1 hypothetical protein SAMN05216233_12738 [Desulfoluna spongiiphila]